MSPNCLFHKQLSDYDFIKNYVNELLHYSCLLTSVTRSVKFIEFWASFLMPLATINLPTFLGNFCKGVKIYHSSGEIIFRQLL